MSMTKNLNIMPEMIGITNLLNPFTSNASGGRLDMFSSHIAQTRIGANCDFPNIFSGFEHQFSKYTMDTTARDNDVRVLAIVHKYDMQLGAVTLGNNPSYTVIYRDLGTGEIGYFNVKKYTHMTNGFGYRNIPRPMSVPTPGSVITKDEKLYESAANQDGVYKMGVNANVAFITTLDTTEDALVMSESIAKKLQPISIETKTLKVDLRRYPLNIYGNEEEYKIMPDIGDRVNANGILCAFRKIKKFSAISDLGVDKLTKVNHLYDDSVYAHPNAKVIDIEVHLDSKCKLPARVYDQVHKYRDARLTYYREIVNVYEEYKNLPLSDKFNTLVTRAMGRLIAAKKNVKGVSKRSQVKLVDKISPIQLQIEVTLAHDVLINKGHKSTGREGAKGVIVVIKPDHEMPIDEQGIRADICIDPMSVIKRTNVSQMHEQYINRTLKWVSMGLSSLPNNDDRFNRIVEVLDDINPEYAKLIRRTHRSEQLKINYVNESMDNTIRVCIPPTMNNVNEDLIIKLDEKYKTPISPVTFTITASDGTKRKVTTKSPVCIGSKYIYLLSKYPKPIAPGIGHVNQYHFPVSSSNKDKSPIGSTPVRFGESESRIFATAIGVRPAIRLRCLYGNSKIGPEALIRALMATSEPSRLGRVPVTLEELQDSDYAIHIMNNMFNTIGLGMQNVLISEDEAEDIFEELRIFGESLHK